MSMKSEKRLLSFLNNAESAAEIVHRATLGGRPVIDLQEASALIRARESLSRKAFRSLRELRDTAELKHDILERFWGIIRSKAWNDRPMLLLPLRLETRFLNNNNELWIRIYPDKPYIKTHEPTLTGGEYTAGTDYLTEISSAESCGGSIDEIDTAKRNAWRSIANRFGSQRAAYIVHTVSSLDEGEEPPLRPAEQEDWLITPRLMALPDRFVAYAYREDEVICKQAGERVSDNLDLLNVATDSVDPECEQPSLFDQNAKWLVDLDEAQAKGMAICMDVSQADPALGFSRLVVVGLKDETASSGDANLKELLDAHHYTTGLSFLNCETPTNNTETVSSGHSESVDETERSYDVEISGPTNWQEPPDALRTNAQRLGHAFGLGPAANELRHLDLAGESGDSYAQEMHTALWPATGGYFLSHILPDIVSKKERAMLADHFIRFVRPGGPLPSLRIDDQPYGILPITSVRAKTPDHSEGWAASDLDYPSAANWYGAGSFDNQLHSILTELHRQWLDWAQDTERVPRIHPFAAEDGNADPDKDLLQLLSMEPTSIAYQVRPFVDERLIAWLLVALRNHVFGPDTPYGAGDSPQPPVYWMRKWIETWEAHKQDRANFWSGVTDTLPESLLATPLWRILAWWSDRQLPIPLGQEDVVGGLYAPDQYLSALCRESEFEPETLLHAYLQLSIDLAGGDGLSAEKVRDAICRLDISSSALDFFNSVTSDEQIAAWIKADPTFGRKMPHPFGDRPSVAERIVAAREALPGKQFTSMVQFGDVLGLNPDALHDIVASLAGYASVPDIGRVFPLTLDAFTNRLDAWISSLPTKRLHAMRKTEPDGIHLGAYGWVEDLHPSENPGSMGFIHTPSNDQSAAAAVLYNAYLSYADTSPNPFRLDLNSDRVRRAMRLFDGQRHGQPLGALLGYQFERALHELQLDHYIDDFRASFPLVADKEKAPNPEVSVETIAARNVVDGLSLARVHLGIEENIAPTNPDDLDTILDNADEHDRTKLTAELDRLIDSIDAQSDLLIFEGVSQAVQGNWERAGAALEAASGNGHPPEIESMHTQVPYTNFGHRLCLLFPQHAEPGEGPRSLGEPRLAAWLSHIFCSLDQIGCSYSFKTERINVNTSEKEELALLPGITSETADQIFIERGAEEFKTLNDIVERVAGINESVKVAIGPWVITGHEGDEFPKFYQRINLNPETQEERVRLQKTLGVELADRINTERPVGGYRRITDLINVGIESSVVDNMRRFVTTRINTVSIAELELDAMDLLYLSDTIPVGEETEIEQRVRMFVRDEYRLSYDTPVQIQFSRPDESSEYSYGVIEAFEFANQIHRMLGEGIPLRPNSLVLAAEGEGLDFSLDDVQKMETRINNVLEKLCGVITVLGGTEIEDLHDETIDPPRYEGDKPESIPAALLRATRFGVPGVIPSSSKDPDLTVKQKQALEELNKRVAECREIYRSSVSAALPARVDLLIDAIQSLHGLSYVILPTFSPLLQEEEHQDDLLNAFADGELRAGNSPERIRLWLQQTAAVSKGARELEDTLMMGDVWCGAVEEAALLPIDLKAAQLPFERGSPWLALSDEERDGASIHDDDNRGKQSIVAATTEAIPAAADATESLRFAGLLLDQWDEQIPKRTVDTSISYQYDRPNSQAPQALLLAVPGQRIKEPALWTEDELAEMVYDTADLSKIRAVDPDAMREIEGKEDTGAGIGMVLPSLFFPTDSKKPGWARKIVTDLFGELQGWEFRTVIGKVSVRGSSIRPVLSLTTDTDEYMELKGDNAFEIWRLASIKIEVLGLFLSSSNELLVESYKIIDIGGGNPPTAVGVLSKADDSYLITEEDGTKWTLVDLNPSNEERFEEWGMGSRLWVFGQVAGNNIDLSRFACLRKADEF